MENSILEATVLRYQADKSIGAELATLFYKLGSEVFDVSKFRYIDKEDALQEVVMLCLDKSVRYNGKCKAYNYFTTIIMCCFRQLYRSKRNQS